MTRHPFGAALLVGMIAAGFAPGGAQGQSKFGSDSSAARAFELAAQTGCQVGMDADEGASGRGKGLTVFSLPKDPRVGDALLEQFQGFAPGVARAGLAWPGLLGFQKLRLAETGTTDRGLALLRGAKSLEYLDVAGTKITDAGLAELLPTLPRLRVLILGDPRDPVRGQIQYAAAGVTDRGMAAVGKVKTLGNLRLAGLGLTDAGLAPLAGLENLEGLNLQGTGVGDAGLAHVRKMERLSELNLAYTKVTDAGLAHLAGSPQLLTLALSQTAVSDAGLAHLADLPMMRVGERTEGRATQKGMILLAFTDVTDDGLAKLREQLPRVTIYPEKAVPRPKPAAEAGTPATKDAPATKPAQKKPAQPKKKVQPRRRTPSS
jgi:hypothetical protein